MIYPEYGKDLANGSLIAHHQTHHCVVKGGSGQEGDKEVGGDEPRAFRMALPEKSGPRPFPVEGCSGRAVMRTSMRVHFWHRHVRNTVLIMEDRNLPHPR